jgi:hypothetical protein
LGEEAFSLVVLALILATPDALRPPSIFESVARVAKLLAIKVPVVVFVNNHLGGYAHDTVRELLKTLDREVTPF